MSEPTLIFNTYVRGKVPSPIIPQLLAQGLGWNEDALTDQYLEQLSEKVLDEVAQVKHLPTLAIQIQLCMHIDGRLED